MSISKKIYKPIVVVVHFISLKEGQFNWFRITKVIHCKLTKHVYILYNFYMQFISIFLERRFLLHD